MNTFKPGDRIRRISDPLENVPIGFETVAVEPDPVSSAHDVVWFKWPGKDRTKVHSKARSWELVEDAAKPAPQITVGSRWRFFAPTTSEFYTSGEVYTVRSEPGADNMFNVDDNKNVGASASHYWNASTFLQAFVPADPAEPALPVRTRTVIEIVPGQYGQVSVMRIMDNPGRHVAVALLKEGEGVTLDTGHYYMAAAELRAAARVFVSLAEALEESP